MAQRYRHKIVIQTPTESLDDYGEVTESWDTHLTVWASKENVSAGEAFEAGSVVETNTFIFECYYASTVTTDMRISYDSRFFDIEAVENVDNKGRKMRLRATETDSG